MISHIKMFVLTTPPTLLGEVPPKFGVSASVKAHPLMAYYSPSPPPGLGDKTWPLCHGDLKKKKRKESWWSHAVYSNIDCFPSGEGSSRGYLGGGGGGLLSPQDFFFFFFYRSPPHFLGEGGLGEAPPNLVRPGGSIFGPLRFFPSFSTTQG